MAEARWIYDLTIFLYAASVLFYFNDFLLSNRKANRIAFGLLAVVWALQTVFFVSQMAAKPYFPVLTLFETLFFYSWILVTVSLAINYFFRIDLLIFFLNVIGFVVLTASMFFPETSSAAHSKVISELLFIHVTLAMFSYAAFALSMILSVLYLLQNKLLKQKRWTPLLRRLPSLDKLELFSYWTNMVGVPLLLMSLLLGAIWAQLVETGGFWTDAKVWMSLLVLLAYSILLYKRFTEDWLGRKLAWGNLVAFVILLLNFVFTDVISNFHRWM
ncbi:inner membrane protein YpjD [Brevibacillus sp. B_LB10_24]|uniref:cytochrome C assembly family protein n=1 Tax=Brevibacillus sp. B_LB10_24 TaxID=3380645 RepID=UPI0038BDA58D